MWTKPSRQGATSLIDDDELAKAVEEYSRWRRSLSPDRRAQLEAIRKKAGIEAESSDEWLAGRRSLRELLQYVPEFMALADFEFVTLKGILLVEGALAYMLASRLRVDPESLPNLFFATLARVALVGQIFTDDLRAVLELNEIRNSVAHRIRFPEMSGKVRAFCSRSGKTEA